MPETMVRKQVYIERDQDVRLKRYARALGVTEAELIRRGIDAVAPATSEVYGRALRETADAAVESLRSVSVAARMRGWSRDDAYGGRTPTVPDGGFSSWDRALTIMRGYAERAITAAEPESARGWSREDAYAGRIDRVDR